MTAAQRRRLVTTTITCNGRGGSAQPTSVTSSAFSIRNPNLQSLRSTRSMEDAQNENVTAQRCALDPGKMVGDSTPGVVCAANGWSGPAHLGYLSRGAYTDADEMRSATERKLLGPLFLLDLLTKFQRWS
jgi:hypothetical protein